MHQGSVLSPLLFALMLDKLTRTNQDGVSCSILFADDIVLVDESKEGVINKLEMLIDFRIEGIHVTCESY